MSREHGSTARCLAVWLVATTALLGAGRLAGGAAASLVRTTTWQSSFEDLLVAVCAAVLLACGVRLWLVTTVTAVDLVRGRAPRGTRGPTRRLVLAACGAAVLAGISAPAVAGQGGDLSRLAGLPLPDRATAGAVQPVARSVAERPARPGARQSSATSPRAPRASRPTGDEVVVRHGDSLWALAAARLPRSAGPAEVDRAWRAVYAANRAEIGADPGLIRPGQRLHLPETTAEGDDR